MHAAAQSGHTETMELLLKYGAKINERDLIGATPLDLAIAAGHIYVVKYLLEKGANPNQDMNPLGSPLLFSTSLGFYNFEIMKLLLEAGANPNSIDFKGNTPLHNVVERGEIEAIKLLLDFGADPNIKNNEGKTPNELTIDPEIKKLFGTK